MAADEVASGSRSLVTMLVLMLLLLLLLPGAGLWHGSRLTTDDVGVDDAVVSVDVVVAVVAVAGCGAVDRVASGSGSLVTLTLSSVILEQRHQQEKLVIHSS